ncbi:hypothetical protein MBLNU230_g2646t1 [Neophaeotheca triangularis]
MVTPIRQTLETKLLNRELYNSGVRGHYHRSLYSDRRLINNLDIVNELEGHSGCVNALSWSKSGNLLASGSDDQHINIHTYQPHDSDEHFRLSATVATGHTQNIFSVKFMPHSDDRTVISAAGDGEVRVFDLEHSGATTTPSTSSARASTRRRMGRDALYANARYLTDGDTDCRVYRSHGDRVKRIVTESSPHLFLTCSEDGEVRQWDLRQPSSAYPSPRDSDDVPPPLISYKRYHLDLNSISCSPSQPHYIALGGAHLHAFLHDRRMSGRDLLRERGATLSPADRQSDKEEEGMASATQCVRKFAPSGQERMKRTQSGHITALKISDARPDEMIVSWSGDNIYSFDLVQSPDAGEVEAEGGASSSGGRRVKGADTERKRKRMAGGGSAGSVGEDAASRGTPAPRTESPTDGDAALRIRYQNGQSEDVPLAAPRRLTQEQQEARRIAQATQDLRQKLSTSPPEPREPHFSHIFHQATKLLQTMDETMREWRYPLAPTPQTVAQQQTLRRHRENARRFVQATGVLSRVLGGSTPSHDISSFTRVHNRSNDLPPDRHQRFVFDFVAAICLWLDSGPGRLIEGFTRSASTPPATAELHALVIAEDEAGPEAMDEVFVPYLLGLASESVVRDPDANRFLLDDIQEGRLFATEGEAVDAFARAVGRPFADLSGEGGGGSGMEGFQDRAEAVRFWGLKVARAMLLGVSEELDVAVLDKDFGGVGRRVGESLGGQEEEVGVTGVSLRDRSAEEEEIGAGVLAEEMDVRETDDEDEDEASASDHDDDDVSSSPDISSDEDEDEDDEEDGVPTSGIRRFLYRSAFERSKHKERVALHTPCSASTRVYSGHLNSRTVKDVNFFGPNDDYVISGSDDGNFFLWDRQTAQLVNVLEGDGEVVNVLQGHPYETMLAVSGIDHSVKIFSPDGRAREDARMGRRGVRAADVSDYSSIAWPHRLRTSRRRGSGAATSEPAVPSETSDPNSHDADNDDDDNADDDYDDSHVAENGLPSRRRMHKMYEIVAQNDAQRRGAGGGGLDDDGDEGAYITVRDVQSLLALLAGRLGFSAGGGGGFTRVE